MDIDDTIDNKSDIIIDSLSFNYSNHNKEAYITPL